MNPVLILLALIAPLGALAYFGRIYPHRPLVFAGLVAALASIALVVVPEVFQLLMILDLLLIVVAAADLLTLPKPSTFDADRTTGQIASLRKAHHVTLAVSNRSPRAQAVWIRDDIPAGLEAEPNELAVQLDPRSVAELEYELRAQRRGAFVLSKVYLRVLSRLGLWQRHLRYPRETLINVYPDIGQLTEYDLLARSDRLNLLGVRRTRRIGQDNEFERLRDYTLDDNYKHIDWRSTARRGKLTVKDFQANQSQRVIFLVDCGRMMANTADSLSLLDHALNGMLMLSYVALRQGDAVGLLPFSDEIHRYVPPRGGLRQMNQLLHASFDRFPRLVESRYDQAFLHLSAQCRKRSLVILITNVIDEVNANQVERYLTTLVGRHLPLGVLLRDHRLFDAVAPDGEQELFSAAAAADVLIWRRQVLSDLGSKGVLSLDVFPEQLTAPLINRYLEIKARHLL